MDRVELSHMSEPLVLRLGTPEGPRVAVKVTGIELEMVVEMTDTMVAWTVTGADEEPAVTYAVTVTVLGVQRPDATLADTAGADVGADMAATLLPVETGMGAWVSTPEGVPAGVPNGRVQGPISSAVTAQDCKDDALAEPDRASAEAVTLVLVVMVETAPDMDDPDRASAELEGDTVVVMVGTLTVVVVADLKEACQ